MSLGSTQFCVIPAKIGSPSQVYKAKQITRVSTSRRTQPFHRTIVIPSSGKAQVIGKALKKTGVRLVEKAGMKIGDLVKLRRRTENKDSVVYKVPCGAVRGHILVKLTGGGQEADRAQGRRS